jgi:NAD(P)-dependent dehydrogenase (short-subunit alcohol dehydrogenase family)
MSDLGVAVVTGASGLIGRAVCAVLVEAGHAVVAVDNNPAALASLRSALPGRVVCTEADVTDQAQTEELWRSAEWVPDVRSLVCVAGGNTVSSRPMETISPAEFDATIRLNLTAAWKWSAEAAPVLRRRGEGRIVTFASASMLGGFPDGLSAYIAAKAGVVGLTRALSRELGPDGITVNCVSPGMVHDLEGVKAGSAMAGADRERLAAEYLGLQTTPVVIEPDDIAYAVGYLLSPQARAITGQVLHVNGGCFFGA